MATVVAMLTFNRWEAAGLPLSPMRVVDAPPYVHVIVTE